MSNDEWWNRCALSFLAKIDRIPYFDILYYLFDTRYLLFQFFLIKLIVFQARGSA
ncbi:hypothetical protein D1AOALGA4SA_2541 [Olavius algarvensis Delta 1 endosymbiont]|nr:hypothetical protein D1AOALGA4SA_2541 [Olavius algarvensis Delta 1 endosymbiont]